MLGILLGLNPLVATLLPALGFDLDLGVMSDGLGWAFLKALAIFAMFTAVGATYGWFSTVNRIVEVERQLEKMQYDDRG